MCKMCKYVQHDPPSWTCMSYSNCTKLFREVCASSQECKQWPNFQKHKYCFDASHGTPTARAWASCGATRYHTADSLFLMHPDQAEPLPEPFVKEAFEWMGRSDRSAMQQFLVDHDFRNQHDQHKDNTIARNETYLCSSAWNETYPCLVAIEQRQGVSPTDLMIMFLHSLYHSQ
jgi:hypothetical protein